MARGWLAYWIRRSRSLSPDGSRPLSSLAGAPGFLALDLETTGLRPRRDAIVSAAVVPFVNGAPGPPLVDRLANPGRPVPLASQRVHGITDAMLAGASSSPAVARFVLAACRGRLVVGHNIGFDLAILNRYARAAWLPRLQGPALDVAALARALAPRASALDDLARRAGVPLDGRHTAAGDAVIAGRVLLALLGDLERVGARTVNDLLTLQRSKFGSFALP